jgi:hypothetical protein
MTMAENSPLEFPCDVPIKIFGRNETDFREAALAIVHAAFADLTPAGVSETLSREGRYASLTVTVRAQSRAQLDSVYRELSAHDLVLMVL